MYLPILDPSDSTQSRTDTETYFHPCKVSQLPRRIEFLSGDDHVGINGVEELLPEIAVKAIENDNINDIGDEPQELDKFRMKDSNSRNLDGKWSNFHKKQETNKPIPENPL